MAALGLAADRLDFPMIFRKPPAGRPDMGSTRPTNTARRVRTGFMPDMSGTGPGMLIQGTIAGSPAEKAGIKAGDRLIRFGSQEVKSVEDLQQALTTAQPGVPVKVVVLRDGKEIELTMTPEAASPQG
jgi:S1-C subfamily serine protease